MGLYTASMKRVHRIARELECLTNQQRASSAQPTQPASIGCLMSMWLAVKSWFCKER